MAQQLGFSGRRALLLLPAILLPADVFVLQDGKEIDGYVHSRTAKKEIVIAGEKGRTKVFESAVKETRPSADAAADFARYEKGLPKKDAEALAALGAWAKERGLAAPARDCFVKALALKPSLEAAHRGLGRERIDGEWLTPAEAEARRKDEALRREMGDAYEKALGARPEIALSAHWRCADLLGDGKAAARVADLEAAFAEAVRILGSDPWPGRGLLVACQGTEQYHKWLGFEAGPLPGMRPAVLEAFKAATGMKYTQPPVLGRSDLPDRSAMHAANVHAAGHLLVNNWKGHNRAQPFWIEEGMGGWMEGVVLKSNSSFCWQKSGAGYGSTFRDVKKWEVDDPDWKALVKEAAAKGEFLPLEQLDALPGGEYSRREVGQSFSLVAFLLKEQPLEAFRAYLQDVKSGARSPAAFVKAYGRTLDSLEAEWKAFCQGGW